MHERDHTGHHGTGHPEPGRPGFPRGPGHQGAGHHGGNFIQAPTQPSAVSGQRSPAGCGLGPFMPNRRNAWGWPMRSGLLRGWFALEPTYYSAVSGHRSLPMQALYSIVFT